ncbi:MAG TPA: polyprenol phosphomannose-dependent alpha 1,6 mannosyltransferase MptB [Acidimicrobiales bacterium]|nr:polyprenol phosphomannose-dependent alpha 1,6 mannosyltransferase MptB [Acidimicrobiales bacterium]
MRFTPRSTLSDHVSGDDGAAADWTFLRRPALLGFVAVLSVCVGASIPSSPFKLEMPGTWFFGEGNGTGDPFLLLPSVVAVYGGMLLFVRVWFGLIQTLRSRPGVPIRHLAVMLTLWVVPLLVVAPMFSRDVFSYAAQGEMMSHHINPYNYGPGTLGSGPYVNPVDGLWLNTPAPYGPLFLMIDGWFASLSGHNAMGTVLFLRLLSVIGVALMAYCIPKLAKAYGRDPGEAFVLAVLNPLTLLALIGGAHNDAIMVGLLVAGITAAKLRHPIVGIVLCTLAAAIKVPAAIGIVYVAWDWAGPGVSLRQRVRPLLKAAVIALAVMAVLSVITGLGWGWVDNLGTPGTVRSWMAPATAIGLVISGALHMIGVGVGLGGVLTVTRALGLLGATAIAGYCVLHSQRIGSLRALGITLLTFVLLGPVVQPWYLTWGIVLMAPMLVGRMRAAVLTLSIVVPFIGLTGGTYLLNQLVHTNPLSMVVGVIVLWGIAVMPLGDGRGSWRLDTTRLTSSLPPAHAPEAVFE